MEKEKTESRYWIDPVLILASMFIFWQYRTDYQFILETNKNILLLLVAPFLLISVCVWRHRNIEKSNFLSSVGIVLAILIFLFSSSLNEVRKMEMISDTNDYNCSIASRLVKGINNNDNKSLALIPLNSFITQPYFDNASLILRKLGQKEGGKLLSSALTMQSANGLIGQTQSISSQVGDDRAEIFIENAMKLYNNSLMVLASSTQSLLCKQSKG